MEFKTDLDEIRVPASTKFQLIGAKLPNSNDVYFRASKKSL